MNPNRLPPRHIIFKGTNIKDTENLKSSKRHSPTYRAAPVSLSADFSADISGKKGWPIIVQGMKSKDLQPRLLHPARLSFNTEGDLPWLGAQLVRVSGQHAEVAGLIPVQGTYQKQLMNASIRGTTD